MKIPAFILLFGLLVPKRMMVSTIAGGGILDYNKSATTLSKPNQVTVDRQGNVYIAEFDGHVVRKINTRGEVSVVAGNYHGGFNGDGNIAIGASLYSPTDVAFDNAGNMYIADGRNNRIRKVNGMHIIYTIAGNGQPYSTGDGERATLATLNFPIAIAFDKQDNLLVVERNGHCVRKITPAGIISTIVGNGEAEYSGDGGPATNATLKDPCDIAVDSKNNIYIADGENDRIRMINTAGIITTIAGTGVRGYDKDGTPAAQCRMKHPYGIFIDKKDNVYYSDNENAIIRKIDARKHTVTTIVGKPGSVGYSGDGGAALDCEINDPGGLVIDKDGNLLIADYGNNAVRKISNVLY